MHNKNYVPIALLMAAALIVSACSGSGGHANPGNERETPLDQLALRSVRDCSDYREYLARGWIRRHTSYTYGLGDDMAVPGMPSAGTAAPDTITETNIQEPGVDEQDVVKTDRAGRFYIAHDRYLIVETGFPAASLGELARLDVNMRVRALYFDESSRRIALFGLALWDAVQGSREIVSFIDVADPAQPRETSRMELSGWEMQTRRVGARIHAFMQAEPREPAALKTSDFLNLVSRYHEAFRNGDNAASAQLYAEIAASVRAAVAAQSDSELLLPASRVQDGVRTPLNLLACADIQRPDITTMPGLGALISFNLDGTNPSATAVAGGGQEIYATKENFYVSRASGGWWLDEGTPTRETAVYRFAIGSARPEYRSVGKVRGWTQDQYNFSEHAGVLRIASNDGRGNNFLSVLEDDTRGNLARIAEITGFGAQERMFATRFIGTRGFIVTFRQIDPLFAFDLTDPRNPVLKGELEIPGFSTYAHPLGEHHLLTVGNNGSNALQLQIFDVSDLTAPRVLHRYTPDSTGWSHSPAGWDPHAFTFDAARGVLAIPYYRYSYHNSPNNFSGFLAFRVSVASGFTELTRVDHSAMAYDYYCDPVPRESWYTYPCGDGSYALWTWPRRTVVMTSGSDEYLYTLSDVGIQANHLVAPNYPALASDGF